ncbi:MULTISPECIES: GAF domain-containing protein [Anaeromyxobacter]|uniref:GAF domain-containing protein n=1 Tax=Anaeromyxobacter TaxID=161492 RepID=UPI001F577D72|nr:MULTISPECIES: GAF domain-containing protein [unclassified Anaeromyxobacter]
MIRLEELGPCFPGIVPAQIATCGRDGEPNVTYLSQVQYVDPRRVALSCQFFNKTRRNVEENPLASVLLYHPLTFEAYRLRLRFEHAETEGPLFDTMALRIQVIASHTGMTGVFALRSADVYEVLSVERVEGLLLPADPALEEAAPPLPAGPLTEIRGLQVVSDRIARAPDLPALLAGALEALDALFGFSHAMVLVPAGGAELVAIASHGYGEAALGARARIGAGIIGCVAQRRRMLRVAGVGAELRYGRAVRERLEAAGGGTLPPEVPLPGLPDAQAQLALPLLVRDRLVGVLAFESRDPLCFDDWDEAFLGIVGNQIAMGMDRLRPAGEGTGPFPAPRLAPAPERRRVFCYYRNDDCVFVDGEYLIRNVPGRILWKLLGQHRREGRTEFTNRELRLDPALGLPAVKDNLESRLILLRRRLQEKCPEVRLVPVRRGRFALELDCAVSLLEKECG